ncbi:MAG TPA: YdeI/OmpD-associated family protein [Chitinophagaceae bacterium]|nr:YdeI/OmpD-associated family protein [Chitinophagaceae bacterium]
MVRFNTVIKKFGEQGEKTGWSYIEIPAEIANKIKPGYKRSFRVKGMLDEHKIERVSLLPMGGGNFIIPLNATLRKALGKRKGEIIKASLTEDARDVEFNKNFLLCLEDDPAALEFFNSLPGSHRNYFSKWIDSAKTEETKEKRIARAVSALSRKLGYAEMMRMKNDGIF